MGYRGATMLTAARSMLLSTVTLCALASALGGCAAAEKAAAKDPMKCERDPDCAKKRGKNTDCTTQCVDNPECMDRCAQMSAPFR
jgi:hypothetical protein